MIKFILFLVLVQQGKPPAHHAAEYASLDECVEAVSDILHRKEHDPYPGKLQVGCVMVNDESGTEAEQKH